MKFNGTCFIEKKQDKPFLHFFGGNKEFTYFLNKICDDGKEYSVLIKTAKRSDIQNALYWASLKVVDDQSDIIPLEITNMEIRKKMLHNRFKKLYARNILGQKPVIIDGEHYYEFDSTDFETCSQDEFNAYMNFYESVVYEMFQCDLETLIDNYKNRI